MESTVHEWLNLLIRWAHLTFGIAWIGSSFYFMWLDSSLEPGTDEKTTGELWMVHSGGFYHVKKKKIAPGEMPRTLHWFKWEAAFTWISGICLLAVVYYLGANLLDESVSSITRGKALALAIGLLFFSWPIYDVLSNKLINHRPLFAALGFALISAVAVVLCKTLSGRAAYIHVGAILGSLMVGNVWMRIIPSQRQMVQATERGETPDYELGERAKMRSVHNTYMTLPVLFIMLSNHFPMTYGHSMNWAVLIGMMIAGALARHVTVVKRGAVGFAVPTAAVLAFVFMLTAPRSEAGKDEPSTAGNGGTAAATGTPIDPATAGAIAGVVRFEGTAPEASEIAGMPTDCAKVHGTDTPRVQRVLAKDGKLANVFVWIKEGLGNYTYPDATAPAILDQRGCLYEPHVLGIRTNQPLEILNSDALAHNVNARLADKTPAFNEGMTDKGQKLVKRFKKAEIMARVKCDIHPWMAAFIGVVPHPFFAVTDAEGRFAFDRVPPGEYVLEAWHETLGTQTAKVKLDAKGRAEAAFTFGK